jgi:hypothetical protein
MWSIASPLTCEQSRSSTGQLVSAPLESFARRLVVAALPRSILQVEVETVARRDWFASHADATQALLEEFTVRT